MAFWWSMFFVNLLYSLAMLIGGRVMWKYCAGRPGCMAGGYRSHRSMLNADTWRFANENCGRRWFRIGQGMLIPTVLVQLPFYGRDTSTVGLMSLAICVVECAVMLLSILPTEKALKEAFNEDGTWKN